MRKFNGRKKITIPVSLKNFNENPLKVIENYLGKCISVNNQNRNDSQILKQYYVGIQKILNKTRLNGDSNNNNILLANHIFRQVEFKKGFMVGNPINYSLGVSDKNTDDLTYLQKYFKDSMKASKDIDKYEDLYVSGLAVQFVAPKTYDFDEESESPFELYNIENNNGFKVYSSDISSKPLFDVVISKIADTKDNFTENTIYDIYFINPLDNFCYNITYDRRYQKASQPEKQPYTFLPLVEYSLNKNRMGIVELVKAIQDGLNIIQSNQIDDIVEFVNSYLVFENQDLGKEWAKKVKEFRQNRAIMIKSNNPKLPAKISLLKQTMQHTEINAFFELLVQEMYDIVACPKTSGGVTSGGDTGQARILGNGWESAQNQATVDISYVMQYEYELLKKIISISKNNTSKIKEVNASDIDIKYSINMSNNILTKTQALSNLYTMHIPYEDALNITGVTNDAHGLGIKWAENDELQKTIAIRMQSKNLTVGNETNNSNNNEKADNETSNETDSNTSNSEE